MSNRISNIAEKILGRLLSVNDGLQEDLLAKTEKKLGLYLPNTLKQFYLLLGKNETFTSAFQYFAPVEELYVLDNKLIFLEENQSVCFWGINVDEMQNENPLVYQCPYTEWTREWISEEVGLNEFIEILLYYQAAVGGYECTGFLNKSHFNKIRTDLEKHWEKVVVHNGLIIYWHEGKFIWYFLNHSGKIVDFIYASAISESKFTILKSSFGFET